MQTGLRTAAIGGIYAEDRRKRRNHYLLAFGMLIILFLFYISFRSTEIGFLTPVQTISNLYTGARLKLAELFHWSLYDDRYNIIKAHDGYLETMTRINDAVIAMAVGACMAVAGAVFQCVFRNPIAVPSMIGVSSGINLANMILVVQYSAIAETMVVQRYVYGYIASIAILFIVLLLGKLSSKTGRINAIDVLLIGTVMTRIITRVVQSIAYTMMEETDYEVLQEMSTYGTGMGNTNGLLFLSGAVIIGLLPILLMRNSLNIVTFPDEEARVMGLDVGVMRVITLVFSTVLVTAAQIHCGDIGMLALMVPHICRYLFGSNTRELIVGSIVFGGMIMLICRFVTSIFAFNAYLSVVSIGTIINFITMPIMFFMMISQRRGWN